MELIIGTSHANTAEKLKVNKENNFAYVIKKIEDIQEYNYAGNDQYSDLLYILKNINVTEGRFYEGNLLYVDENDVREIEVNISQTEDDHASSIYELWLNILRNTESDIDEEFRYGATESNENIMFLRSVVQFLSYITITLNHEMFEKHKEQW